MTTRHEHFDSADGLLHAASTRKMLCPSGSSTQPEKPTPFFGSNSFDEATAIARNGWQQGRDKAAELADRITPESTARTFLPVPTWDVTGDFVDVGAYLTGEPECMVRDEIIEREQSGKIVAIAVNMGAPHFIAPEAIIRRGSALIALVDLLEQSGLSCEITVFSRSETVTAGIQYSATLKRAGEAVELDRLAFWLAHPSALRRIIFRLRETERNWKALHATLNSDYGKSVEMTTDEQDGYDIYLSRNTQFHSDTEARKWVLDQLAKQGITIEESATV